MLYESVLYWLVLLLIIDHIPHIKISTYTVNTMRPRQNGRHFADYTFKPIFLNENIRISIKISLEFVPQVPINNIPALD